MGQYYCILNVDKKQQLQPRDYDNFLKLTEWSYDINPMVLAMMNLLGGAWKGDRVFVVGDYASPDNPKDLWYEPLKKALSDLGMKKMYDEAGDKFQRILPEKSDENNASDKTDPRASIEDQGFRYIYNHSTKQFIDLSKCPIEWIWYDPEAKKPGVTRIAPLPLLLAMGNGQGGGDYYGRNSALVGTWCATVSSIEVAKSLLEGKDGYVELTPDFTENKEIIPYTELAASLAGARDQYIDEYLSILEESPKGENTRAYTALSKIGVSKKQANTMLAKRAEQRKRIELEAVAIEAQEKEVE